MTRGRTRGDGRPQLDPALQAAKRVGEAPGRGHDLSRLAQRRFVVGEENSPSASQLSLSVGIASRGVGNGEGARAVLEVRSHEVPFILEDGQIIGRLVYEPLTEAPERVYGQGIGSNYQRQGLKLSKHFKPFKP